MPLFLGSYSLFSTSIARNNPQKSVSRHILGGVLEPVGPDEVLDGLDGAVEAAEELLP